MNILFEDKNLKKCATVWAKERVAKMLEIADYHK